MRTVVHKALHFFFFLCVSRFANIALVIDVPEPALLSQADQYHCCHKVPLITCISNFIIIIWRVTSYTTDMGTERMSRKKEGVRTKGREGERK